MKIKYLLQFAFFFYLITGIHSQSQNLDGVCGLRPANEFVWVNSSISFNIDWTVPSGHVSTINATYDVWPSYATGISISNNNFGYRYRSYNDGYNTICVGFPVKSSAQAETQYVSGGRLTTNSERRVLKEADITINYNYVNSNKISIGTMFPTSNQYDGYSIMLHEFGHFVGFEHSYATQCSALNMYAYFALGQVRRSLTSYERTVMNQKY